MLKLISTYISLLKYSWWQIKACNSQNSIFFRTKANCPFFNSAKTRCLVKMVRKYHSFRFFMAKPHLELQCQDNQLSAQCFFKLGKNTRIASFVANKNFCLLYIVKGWEAPCTIFYRTAKLLWQQKDIHGGMIQFSSISKQGYKNTYLWLNNLQNLLKTSTYCNIL